MGTIPIERAYMFFMFIYFLIWPGKRWIKSIQHFWILGFLGLHYLLAPFAHSQEAAMDQGFEYFKMVVFYGLMISCIRNEIDLRYLILAFLIVMAVYMAHSLREFIGGRHFYRMGIVRMIGIDQAYNDPNTFAASIVFSLPFAVAIWRAEPRRLVRYGCIAFGMLAIICIVLTGSRSGFLCFAVFTVIAFWRFAQKKNFKYYLLFIALLPGVFFVMPSEKQNRIRTIWDADAGPQNAQESLEGRFQGLESGLRMFLARPLTGVGAGKENFIGYRVTSDDGVSAHAHNLLGELLGEFGVFGTFFFLAQILTTLWCCRTSLALSKALPPEERGFLPHAATALTQGVVLLLVSGLAGHNLYRPHWLWFAAWAMLALEFTRQRVYAAIPQTAFSPGRSYPRALCASPPFR